MAGVLSGGRHGGGDKGSLVLVVDAQGRRRRRAGEAGPGRRAPRQGVSVARVLVDGKLVAAGVREARVLNLAPGESHALRVEAVNRRPHQRAVHGRLGDGGGAGSVALRPGASPSRTCRRSTGRRHGGARAQPACQSRSPGQPASRRPHRRPRQKPDTATVWSATTSLAVSKRRFCASRLARPARHCFDLGACRA